LVPVVVDDERDVPRRARAHVDGRERLRLHDLDQALAQQLEDGGEGHRDAHPALLRAEQRHELDERLAAERAEHLGHALAHREPLALDLVVREHLRAAHHVLERDQHLLQRHRGQHPHHASLRELGGGRERVAVHPRQLLDVGGGALEALVLLQAAHQLGARVLLLGGLALRARQQHARLDLRQRGGHQHVLAGELELQLLHQLDVLHVLPGDLRKRDVEDVEVLAADQVQQQV